MGKPNSKLKAEDKSDLGEIPEKELREWYIRFLIDCQDQTLTVDEFKKIYGNFFPFRDAEKFSEDVFSNFDANKADGSVDFMAYITAKLPISRYL